MHENRKRKRDQRSYLRFRLKRNVGVWQWCAEVNGGTFRRKGGRKLQNEMEDCSCEGVRLLLFQFLAFRAPDVDVPDEEIALLRFPDHVEQRALLHLLQVLHEAPRGHGECSYHDG